jgi:cytidylate kinase
MINRKVITVDGLLGTGKTTISKLLAKELGYVYLSSGMLYRGVALACLEANVKDLNDAKLVSNCIKNKEFELILTNRAGEVVSGEATNEIKQCLLIDGENVTEKLYSLQVSQGASKVATHKQVRDKLIDIQRNAFKGSNIVAEGRDMGSVIFPNAELKFYIIMTKICLKMKLSL